MSLSASSSCCRMKNEFPGSESYLIGLSASNVTGVTFPASSSFVSCCAYSVILAATLSSVSGDCCAMEPMMVAVRRSVREVWLNNRDQWQPQPVHIPIHLTYSDIPLLPPSAGQVTLIARPTPTEPETRIHVIHPHLVLGGVHFHWPGACSRLG